MWYMHNAGWGWWLLMSLGTIALWGLAIYGVAWLLRGASSTPFRPAMRQSPAEILKRRLAEGQITTDEYQRLRRAIDDQPREPTGR